MKEWCIKHPILTFLLADSAICGIVNVIKAVTGIFSSGSQTEEVAIEEDYEEDKAE